MNRPKRRLPNDKSTNKSRKPMADGSSNSTKKPYDKFRKPLADDSSDSTKKPYNKFRKPLADDSSDSTKKPFNKNRKPKIEDSFETEKKPKTRGSKRPVNKVYKRKPKAARDPFTEPIRLNRYIANAGICSRRDADKLITEGLIEVNDKVVTELGTKVKPEDIIRYAGEILKSEKNIYVLMNKPKDYITTLSDPQGRKTVMDLLRGKVKERIYPVGRLDRETTGLLLFTNDGELAKKLSHPSHMVKKIYRVTLNKKVRKEDLEILVNEGVKLEDGIAKADEAAFVNDPKQPNREIGIQLHSGKNRIVRRMMEALGYEVVKLDRVLFAGLDKKNLPRGYFRHLLQSEVNMLKGIK